jgi:hypothetical protein
MKLSNIKSFFEGSLTAKNLKANILEEIEEYKLGSKTEAKNMPVYVTEDIELNIVEIELEFLCNAYLEDELEEIELNYLADALLLSNRVTFENESIADRTGYLTDPEINGHLTKSIV